MVEREWAGGEGHCEGGGGTEVQLIEALISNSRGEMTLFKVPHQHDTAAQREMCCEIAGSVAHG